jgi:hypothetical protein
MAVIIGLAIVVGDILLSSTPGPAPTAMAIRNVEHNPEFLSLTNFTIMNGIPVNASYTYVGYSNEPSPSLCIRNPNFVWLGHLDPLHRYGPTTLFFDVQIEGMHALPNGTTFLELYNLYIQVNPDTGQILGVKKTPYCL